MYIANCQARLLATTLSTTSLTVATLAATQICTSSLYDCSWFLVGYDLANGLRLRLLVGFALDGLGLRLRLATFGFPTGAISTVERRAKVCMQRSNHSLDL